jgi:hypothetical protein
MLGSMSNRRELEQIDTMTFILFVNFPPHFVALSP